MKVISFFDSDYNFSATLARICDIESDQLLFISDVPVDPEFAIIVLKLIALSVYVKLIVVG